MQGGAVMTQKYDVTVSDGHGGTATQTVTITINGTNDAPVITSAAQIGSVTEDTVLSAIENTETQTRSGAVLSLHDALPISHTVTFAPQGSGYLGTFALDPSHIDTGNGEIGRSTCWVADSALDFLQGGVVLTQKYDVTVSDGHGGTAKEQGTITINGTNDAPVITSAAQSGSVTEDTDLSANENTETNTRSGAVAFTDADTLDTHTVTFAPQGSGYLGTFALDPSHIDTGNG